MTRQWAGFRGPLPLRRLRAQLLAAFAVMAIVAVVAGGATVVRLLQDYRTEVTTERLRDAALSAGAAGGMLERQGASPATIAANVAAQVPLAGTRVLALDATGAVLADATATGDTPAAESLVGRRLDVPAPPGTSRASLAGSRLVGGGRGRSLADLVSVWPGDPAVRGARGQLFVAVDRPGGALPLDAVTPPGAQPRAQGPLPEQPEQGPPLAMFRVVLAAPLDSLPSAWQELIPGLATAAAVALLAAAVVAWWLADSIARPIRAVTQATERVARGAPHRPVPEVGAEEVTQLARGFNAMAREVERSQETLRDFVADASHELRTPLTAIQGFSQAVEDGVLEAPEPTRNAARHIHREAERMRRLVEDLLLLSKMEAHDHPAVPAPVNIAELLDTLAQRLQLVLRQRGLHLVLELPERLLAAGDATQLEHLFGNLLDNATKYTPEGGTITVRAALVPRDTLPHTCRMRVSVAVHNTGSHIPPEALPYLFERFYRVDKSRARSVAGSGLGLAIARQITERHGGTIDVESDPSTGTTFVVTLPADPEGSAHRGLAGPSGPSGSPGAGFRRVSPPWPWPRAALTAPSPAAPAPGRLGSGRSGPDSPA